MSQQEWSIAWDSNDFGGLNFNLHVENPHHPGLAKPRVNVMELSAADGGVSQGATWGPIYIRLTCWIAGDSAQARDTYLGNLCDALETTQEGEKPLVLGWLPHRQYQARLTSEVDAEVAITGAKFQLEFVVPSGTYTVI